MKTSLLMLAGMLLTGTLSASPSSVSDDVIERFISAYRDDPAALMQHASLIRHASVEQMRHTISSLGLTHFTYLYPMVIPGSELDAARELPLERLSLMSVRGGKLIPIPFQIDEFSRDGLIWIDGETPGKPAGKQGLLDDYDELVFMYRDGGTERYDAARHGIIKGSVLQEIRLDNNDEKPRYAYLVQDQASRSAANYVDISLEEGRIESTVMRMHFDKRNLLGIHHVESLVGPHAGENVFDNIHISLSTGILSPNLRFSLNTEDNIRVVPRAVARGPIRNTVLLKVRIWYLGMPTIVSQDIHVHFYEQGAVIPIPFAISSIGSLRHFISLLREPRFELNVDFHQLDGANVTFDSVYRPESQGDVDGWMTDFEVGMNYARMPGDWLHLDSRRGWQMFFVNGMPMVEGGLFDQFMEGTELGMVYRDDRELQTRSMRYTGTLPRLGFRLNGMPTPAMDLLAASPKMPRSISTLGEAIIWLGAEPDRLKRYDEAANRMLARLKTRGMITTADQLAEAFITDMSRMQFSGLPREQLNSLITDAIRTTVTDVGQVRHGEILATMVKLAERRGIALKQLRHAHINMALWFPDATGDAGPQGFFREISRPPRALARPATELVSQ